MNSNDNCSNCKFNPHGRFCQRYPKTSNITHFGDTIFKWPPVNPVEWCGEYSPNKEREHQKFMTGA